MFISLYRYKMNTTRQYVFIAIAVMFLISVLSAQAANVSQDVTLQTTGGADVTLIASSDFDTLTIGTNSFTFDLSGTQSVTLRDVDKQVMNSNVVGVNHTCGSGNSEITFSASKAASVIVTMEGFACSSGGGGGGGGGSSSSGGGGTTSSTQTTTTTTTTTTATTSAVTAIPAPVTQTASPYLAGAPPPPVGLGTGVVTIAPVPSGTLFPGIMQLSRGLKVGSSGEDVTALQEALASMPDIYPEGRVTGYFGSLTKMAVAKFQMKYGLVSSASDPGYGYVGPMTRVKLQGMFGSTGAALPPQAAVPAIVSSALTRELNPGADGTDVTQLQAFLAADPSLYPEGKVTGYYGSLTVAAVKRFQARYGIKQLGRVGPQTMAKLNELMGTSVPPPMEQPLLSAPGASSQTSDDAVAKAALQKQINDLQALISSLSQQIQTAQ